MPSPEELLRAWTDAVRELGATAASLVSRPGDAAGELLKPLEQQARALQHILDTFPRDLLFQIREAELLDIAIGILNLQERQRIALFVRREGHQPLLVSTDVRRPAAMEQLEVLAKSIHAPSYAPRGKDPHGRKQSDCREAYHLSQAGRPHKTTF